MNVLQELEQALKEYLLACYGDPHMLGIAQLKEVRQAFLSGVHWRDTKDMSPGKCEDALLQMLIFKTQL